MSAVYVVDYSVLPFGRWLRPIRWGVQMAYPGDRLGQTFFCYLPDPSEFVPLHLPGFFEPAFGFLAIILEVGDVPKIAVNVAKVF